MLLSALLKSVGLSCRQTDVEVSRVTDDLSRVRANTVFVCIRGQRCDGHTLAAAAEQQGAAAVIAETEVPCRHAYYAADTRLALSLLCAAFCGEPHRRLRLVGITGTNGKTTTALYLSSILSAAGERCAVLGTLGFTADGKTEPTGFTTPGSERFFAAVKTAADLGCDAMAAEISSQALAQRRADGARFTLGVMTNVGRDHLDYHGDLQSLVAAKTRLCGLSGAMLLNADDPFAPAFSDAAAAAGADVYDYALSPDAPADFSAQNLRRTGDGTAFDIVYRGKVYPAEIHTPGRFSVYNALAAFSAAVLCGVTPETAAAAVASLPQPPGRAQMKNIGGVRVCVDYAHTPDALAAILQALQREEGRMIAVFGCGGDRDRGKRPLMGAAAARYASPIILTSDNPRSEDPMAIISEIRAGIPAGTPVLCEPDRGKAIRLALEAARPGDTVLIAGKGHETGQTTNNGTLPFSDMEEVEKYAAETCPREEKY